MKTTHTLKASSVLIGAAISCAFFLPTSAYAADASTVMTPVTAKIAADGGYGNGYGNVINGHAANVRIVTITGTDQNVNTYCIQEGVDINSTALYTASTRASANLPNLGKAADISAHGSSLGTALTDPKGEAAAEQLAIWHLVNGTVVNTTTVNNPAIVARTTQLVADAVSLPEGPSNYALTLSATQASGKDTVHVKLVDNTGAGVKGSVSLLGTGINTKVTTDASGVASYTIPAPAAAFNVNASYTGLIGPGTPLLPTSGQKLITSQPISITRAASAVLPAKPVVVVVTPTPTPTHSTPVVVVPPVKSTPVPVPAPSTATPVTVAQTQLPYTGTWVTTPVALGAVALLGGGWAMRRRTKNNQH